MAWASFGLMPREWLAELLEAAGLSLYMSSISFCIPAELVAPDD